jgi:hypothetical protein
MTRMAASERGSALAQNGWDDHFLDRPPLRQFLLAEQSRIDAVLRGCRHRTRSAARSPSR